MNRSEFIGGSDLSAIIFGEDRWGVTKYQLFLEKTGIVREINKEKEEFFERRKLAEPYILSVLNMHTGITPICVNKRYYHKEHVFFSSEIDFEYFDKNGRIINGEIKTITPFYKSDEWGDELTDQVPDEYIIQAQWNMSNTDRELCHLIVMSHWDDFRQYYIKRNNGLIESLKRSGHIFWDCVRSKKEPIPLSVNDFIIKGTNNRPIEATEDVVQLITKRKELKQKEKELEEVDKLIKCYIGENQTLMFKGAIIATWNEQETTRLMQKEIQKDHPDLCSNYLKTTGTRVLRIK